MRLIQTVGYLNEWRPIRHSMKTNSNTSKILFYLGLDVHKEETVIVILFPLPDPRGS